MKVPTLLGVVAYPGGGYSKHFLMNTGVIQYAWWGVHLLWFPFFSLVGGNNKEPTGGWLPFVPVKRRSYLACLVFLVPLSGGTSLMVGGSLYYGDVYLFCALLRVYLPEEVKIFHLNLSRYPPRPSPYFRCSGCPPFYPDL